MKSKTGGDSCADGKIAAGSTSDADGTGKQSVKEQLSQLEQEKQTIKKDLEESLQEAGAAREELAAVRQAQVEAYMKRKPFPKRQGTVELKDAILRL